MCVVCVHVCPCMRTVFGEVAMEGVLEKVTSEKRREGGEERKQ